MAATILFSGLLLGWNGWWLIHGIATGSVETLQKHANYLIYAQAEPGWFALNIVIRLVTEIIFGYGIFAYIKSLGNDGQGGPA